MIIVQDVGIRRRGHIVGSGSLQRVWICWFFVGFTWLGFALGVAVSGFKLQIRLLAEHDLVDGCNELQTSGSNGNERLAAPEFVEDPAQENISSGSIGCRSILIFGRYKTQTELRSC